MNNKGHFSFTIVEVITVLGIAIGIPTLIVLVLGGIIAKALKYFGYFPKWDTFDLMLITVPPILIILFIIDAILKNMGY